MNTSSSAGAISTVPWTNSRYNFAIPLLDRVLLYNSNSGAALQFTGDDASRLGHELGHGFKQWFLGDLPEDLFATLREGGFLVHPSSNEVDVVRERYHRARESTPLVVTLTTTMDCNLACYYCYEARSGHRLKTHSLPALVASVRERLQRRSDKSLHVDWYGGEPTLNLEYLESASAALQELCRELGVRYSASIISNGTTWPEDASEFLERNRIRQAQISFDGLKESHDKRRRYRREWLPQDGRSSFEVIAGLVDRLLDHVRVDIRINVDRKNQHELVQFLDFAKQRGWFSRKYLPSIQPARISAYSEKSEFIREHQISTIGFDELRAKLRAKASSDVLIEESEAPDGYPYPKTAVCAALARDSFVLGADGLEYRCGLQVGERHRAVGRVDGRDEGRVFPDTNWWEGFDPTTQPNCSRCSFLPICWGGCPKKHLEKDADSLHEQSVYWRRNLARLVAARFGLAAPADFGFSEIDQFR